MKQAAAASFEAGDLRRRVALQSYTDAPNGSGGVIRTWSTVHGCNSIPCRITYPTPSKKGDESTTQHQTHSSTFITITMRFRPSLNIDASMRFQYGTRIFEIRTVLPVDEYRQEVTLQCQEVYATGTQH